MPYLQNLTCKIRLVCVLVFYWWAPFSRMSIPAATTYVSRHETFISQQQLNATQKSKQLNINIMATDTDSHASSGSQYLQDVLGDVLGTQQKRQFCALFDPYTMLQKLSKCEVKAWLCWNLIILLPPRFYAKSNFGEFKQSKNVIFGYFRGSEFWF